MELKYRKSKDSSFHAWRILILLIAFTFSVSAFSSANGPMNCQDALKSHEGLIEDTDDLIVNNEFTMTRGLLDFGDTFGKPLFSFLLSLKSGETWLDAGAGFAIPQLEFKLNQRITSHFRSSESIRSYVMESEQVPDLKLVAVSYKKPTTLPKGRPDDSEFTFAEFIKSDFYDYAHFRKNVFEQSIRDKTLTYMIGDILDIRIQNSVSVLTDMFGPAIYAKLPEVLRKYHSLLRLGGKAFVNMEAIEIYPIDRIKVDDYRYSVPRNVNPDSNAAYVHSIKGFDVEYDAKKKMLILTKNADGLYVPNLQHIRSGLSYSSDDLKVIYGIPEFRSGAH